MPDASPVKKTRGDRLQRMGTDPSRGRLEIPEPRKKTGQVFVFGNGDVGQLGLGDEMLERKRPMPLKSLEDEDIVDIVAGGIHTIAITKEGKLWSWGCNDQGALGRDGEEMEPGPIEGLDNVKFVKLACGDSISLALTDDGKVYSWGSFRTDDGILGFSKEQKVQSKPALFTALEKFTIVDIAAGTDHAMALTDEGHVYSWGDGKQFQLGRRIMERRKTNGLVPERLALRNIIHIASGAYHSFALNDKHELFTWGCNNFKQTGLSEEYGGRAPDVIESPTKLETFTDGLIVKQVDAGEHHTVVLLTNGHVYTVGRADSSQLGLPDTMLDSLEKQEDEMYHVERESTHKRAIGLPTEVPNLSNVQQIVAGSNHTIAVTKDGKAYAWGFGESYQLGSGADEDEKVPHLVEGQKIEGLKIHAAAAGGQHSVILAD
ncbi:hypothetical protein NQZ79_g5897 [Umbelopsis isabellina]|nr:hypothetical protein NQZ79_g5897 [Umbelopsis isabellina]